MNEASWIRSCCRISARARDLLEGRLALFEAADAIQRLAKTTRAPDNDRALLVFATIYRELSRLPVGSERANRSDDALRREDKTINVLESQWRSKALVAAHNLIERYAWAYERRADIRRIGDAVKPN
jgi:hypothetical protein